MAPVVIDKLWEFKVMERNGTRLMKSNGTLSVSTLMNNTDLCRLDVKYVKPYRCIGMKTQSSAEI